MMITSRAQLMLLWSPGIEGDVLPSQEIFFYYYFSENAILDLNVNTIEFLLVTDPRVAIT